MIKTNISKNKTNININKSVEGETIEQKCKRIENNKEPITDTAPIIWTERSEGVLPCYNIRTDRFEIAIEAMDKVTKSKMAQRDKFYEEKNKKESPGGESIQGTSNEEVSK